jgi:4-amino-4-deoxy-L-arabinose transferase-like glycosyltransferase
LLASCWFGVWFVFWSVCKTKLPHYLLPAYPALALLVACWIDRWLNEKNGPVPGWGPRNAWISMIVAGVGIMIAVPIVAAYRLPGEEWLGLIGLILVVGGGCCWWESAHERRRQAAAAFAITSVVFLTAVFGFAALRVDRHQNAKPMIAAIHADWGGKGDSPHLPRGTVPFSSPPIATYGLFRESTVFYAGRPVTRCSDDPAKGLSARKLLADFVAQHEHQWCYVITSTSKDKEDDDEAKIEQAFPGVFEEIYRYPRFLEPEGSEMVILRAGRRK